MLWKNKYKRVKCPKEFLGMAYKSGYILEHRLVAAIKYGRMLKSDDVVHHRNGKKYDNNPGNLIILTVDQHFEIHGGLERFIKRETSIKKFKKGVVPISQNIGFRNKPSHGVEKKCIQCGKLFDGKKLNKKFCSAICCRKNWRKENPIAYERIKRG